MSAKLKIDCEHHELKSDLKIGSVFSKFFQNVRSRIGGNVEIMGESRSVCARARKRMLLSRLIYREIKGK